MKKWRLPNELHYWWSVFVIVCVLTTCVGCLNRGKVVYVPDGQPVRLREIVRDVKVWVPGTENPSESELEGWIPSTMDLPEGWYVLPDDDSNN